MGHDAAYGPGFSSHQAGRPLQKYSRGAVDGAGRAALTSRGICDICVGQDRMGADKCARLQRRAAAHNGQLVRPLASNVISHSGRTRVADGIAFWPHLLWWPSSRVQLRPGARIEWRDELCLFRFILPNGRPLYSTVAMLTILVATHPFEPERAAAKDESIVRCAFKRQARPLAPDRQHREKSRIKISCRPRATRC